MQFLRIWFGIHLAYSGLAYALAGWEPTAMGAAQAGAGAFMKALADVGLYPFIKYLEIVTGLLLIADLAVPLALIAELPLTIVIGFLNLVVEGHGRELYTGPQELFLNISLLFAYGGYYARFCRWRAQPWWLWEGFAVAAEGERQPATDAGAATGAATGRDRAIAIAVIVLLSLATMLASQLLGPPERRLPPRDWLPLLGAALAVLVSMRREA